MAVLNSANFVRRMRKTAREVPAHSERRRRGDCSPDYCIRSDVGALRGMRTPVRREDGTGNGTAKKVRRKNEKLRRIWKVEAVPTVRPIPGFLVSRLNRFTALKSRSKRTDEFDSIATYGLRNRDGKGLRRLRAWLPVRMWIEKPGGGKHDFCRCDQNAGHSR